MESHILDRDTKSIEVYTLNCSRITLEWFGTGSRRIVIWRKNLRKEGSAMKTISSLIFAVLSTASIGVSTAAYSAWAPFAVVVGAGANAKKVDYRPQDPSSKKWKICAVLPHVKDSYWVAVDYGLIDEAKRLGVSLNVYQAGGYDQLPKQISQFEDCVASKADAILVGAISQAGLSSKLKEARGKSIPTIGLINPVEQSDVTSTVTNDQIAMGRAGASFMKATLAAHGGKVVAFPGPQGSGWAEQYLAGFNQGIAGSKISLLAAKFGEPGVATQLRLVEDALQSYPDISGIWGTGPTAEAAVSAVAEAGRNITIISSYADQSSIELLKKKKIAGFVSDAPVMQARIAIDQAVAVLEKRPYEKLLVVPPQVISDQNENSTDFSLLLAPTGWQAQFSVKQ